MSSLGTRFATLFLAKTRPNRTSRKNAVWLTKLFGGRNVASREEARHVLLGCENDWRPLCFAGVLVRDFREVLRAAALGDAFAQAEMASAWGTPVEERFQWAEKSAAQGERDGVYYLGHCFRHGTGCEKDVERAKENLLVAAELGYVYGMEQFAFLHDKGDPQLFAWLGRAASNGEPFYFLSEMGYPIRNFSSGIGHATVVFAIGRALKGHINNEKLTIFRKCFNFIGHISPANQAVHFYEFQLQSYRKAVVSWTIIGLRNQVVKDIRKMVGKMIWDAREKAAYLETIYESKKMDV
jgi:hypothetical protein